MAGATNPGGGANGGPVLLSSRPRPHFGVFGRGDAARRRRGPRARVRAARLHDHPRRAGRRGARGDAPRVRRGPARQPAALGAARPQPGLARHAGRARAGRRAAGVGRAAGGRRRERALADRAAAPHRGVRPHDLAPGHLADPVAADGPDAALPRPLGNEPRPGARAGARRDERRT